MKITVIIPALNKQAAIQKVIHLVKQSPLTDELIVVDDRPVNNAVEKGRKCKGDYKYRPGKGASMPTEQHQCIFKK